MKLAGIIGGTGPESTVEYYRLIVNSYREQKPDGSYPHLVINSIDMNRMLRLLEAKQLPEMADYLLAELRRLAAAGAEFGAVSANTPHIVFDRLRRGAPFPLISIVETACEAATKLGLKRVALMGTRFTMQAGFYPEVFARAGIVVVTPAPRDQEYIHEKYMAELIKGIVRAETRGGMLAIVEGLRREERIDGLILGGTELPLLLGEIKDAGIPFLDTTRLHVQEIVNRILS